MHLNLFDRSVSRNPRLFSRGRRKRSQNQSFPYRGAPSFRAEGRLNVMSFLKRTGIRMAMGILGRALQSASRHDPDIRKEIHAFPEDYTVVMRVWPSGPGIALQKRAGMLGYKKGDAFDANLTIYFKSPAAAWLLLTPQTGPARGFADRRMAVKGDLGCAMVFTRCLNTILAYLYPACVSRRLLKRRPPLSLYKHWIRLKILTAGILFGR